MKKIISSIFILMFVFLVGCGSPTSSNSNSTYTITQYSGGKIINEYKGVENIYYYDGYVRFEVSNKKILIYGTIKAQAD